MSKENKRAVPELPSALAIMGGDALSPGWTRNQLPQFAIGEVKNPYPATTLDRAALDNKLDRRKWRLFCDPGISASGLANLGYLNLDRVGSLPRLGIRFEPTMVLIDYLGMAADVNWWQQEGLIPSGCVRAHERQVAVGAILFWLYRKESLLPDWCHWGEIESQGSRLYVGRMGSSGKLQAGLYPGTDYAPYLRLCLSVRM